MTRGTFTFDKIPTQLSIAEVKFAPDARSFTSKLEAFKLSSNDRTLARISSRHVDIVTVSPLMQLTEADISNRSRLSGYCLSQCDSPSSFMPASM